jgi:hypothetical protein
MAHVSLSPWERGGGEGSRPLGAKALIRPVIGRSLDRPSIDGLWPATFSRRGEGTTE